MRPLLAMDALVHCLLRLVLPLHQTDCPVGSEERPCQCNSCHCRRMHQSLLRHLYGHVPLPERALGVRCGCRLGLGGSGCQRLAAEPLCSGDDPLAVRSLHVGQHHTRNLCLPLLLHGPSHTLGRRHCRVHCIGPDRLDHTPVANCYGDVCEHGHWPLRTQDSAPAKNCTCERVRLFVTCNAGLPATNAETVGGHICHQGVRCTCTATT
mmetsp:Transcript_30967/g.56598  ORF Transcript_30967/g.56598 Transcript_30967/m.56598 type:complete len:209 (+) Transcript_30967:179-805(+)